MFAFKVRKEIALNAILIAALLFNTFASVPALAQEPEPTPSPTLGVTETPTETPTADSTASPTPEATETPALTPPAESTGSASFTPAANIQQVDFSRLPLSFVANLGQFDKKVKFQTNSLGGSIFFTKSEVTFVLMDKKVKSKKQDDDSFTSKDNSKVVQIEYKNAEKSVVVDGLNLLPGVANFMVGSDNKAWVTNAPTYDGIIYRNLYPGIDLNYEGAGRTLKSTFSVAAGIDPSIINWSYKYAGNISVDAEGNLIVTLPAQKADQTDTTLIEHTPIAWQEQDGQRVNISVSYAVAQNEVVSFTFPQGYNPSLPLIIDPTLTYSTYLGGIGTDVGNSITTDAAGNVYITGYSYCTAFPVLNPLQGAPAGGYDVIISKINASGNALRYSTCIGGAGDDMGLSIALDAQERIVVGGVTNSTNFPIVGGIATYGGTTGMCSSSAPCQDAFILALNTGGSAVRYSTYLGGNGREELGDIALNASGKILVVGSTSSSNFPTLNAYDATYATGGSGCSSTAPCYDITVTKINSDLVGTNAILYSTYLGGINSDKGLAMTLDASGKVYLTGYSDSDDYPTRNAEQIARKGSKDIVITVVDTSLSGNASLEYSTYFGAHGSDSGYAIAQDAGGNVYLTGRTSSDEFHLRDPLQYISHAGSTCGGSTCYEAFVTKFNISTNSPIYSTYLGGSQNEEGYGIAVDSYGRAYVTGFTRSTDFPTANPIQATKGADGCATPPCADAFLSVLEPDGQSFAYSTFLGGDQDDIGNGIRVDANNQVYLVGETYSTNFPTTPGVYDVSNTETNKRDVFISKISALTTAPTASTAFHLDARILTGSDDAEQSASGSVSLTSSDLELVRDTNNQTVGLRFAGVNIPQGAVILDAEIQFTVDTATTEATTLTIQAQANDNAPVFTTTANNISSRTRTAASVVWTPAAWAIEEESGPNQRTPNLAPVIQEVISRPGWATGNALAVIVTGIGQRIADVYEDNVYDAAYLHIKYTIPTPTPTPTITNTPTPTKALPAGLSCVDWRDGLPHSWNQSLWVNSQAQVVWDANGMHGSATNSGTYQMGAYLQMPAGGNYKVLFYGQHLNGITVTQGANAPTINAPLSNTLTANPDGSYSVTSAYLEVQWSITAPIDLATTPLFQTFCYSPFIPTTTPTITPTTTTPACSLPATEPSSGPGKILVSSDEWTLSDYGFSLAPDAGQFVRNIAAWFTGGQPGTFLGYSNTYGLTGTQLASALTGAGHSWTVSTTNDFSLSGLLQYDGVFIGGYPADTNVLIQYVQAGGNVYIFGGNGSPFPSAAVEAAQWNPFLNAFGLQLASEYDGLITNTPIEISSTHPVFTCVHHLFQSNGSLISELNPSDPNTAILQYESGQQGRFAVFEQVTAPTPTGPTPTPAGTNIPTLTPTATPIPPDTQALVIPGWIGSPAQQSTISGVVPITLANGITLQSGTLDYWPVDNLDDIHVIATGLGGKTGGETLGSLDTTTLANGSYVIRLQGTNSNSVQQDSGIMITVSGEYKPGRVRFTITDLTIPVAGLPITIARTYDSLERSEVGDFGYGWSLAIGNPKLEKDLAHNVTLTMPDGKRSTFYFTPQPYPQQFGFFMYPHYTPEAGVYGKLEAPDCLVVLSDGKYFCFIEEGEYSPIEYTYTDPYGRKFFMDAGGTLKTITDLNNNVLTFSPNGIRSASAGNINVPFVRNAQGRITQITYPAGKNYVYGYNASGELDTVTFPSVTQPNNSQQAIVLQYSYYTGHFFKDATDPRNIKPVITTYDASNRIQSVTDAAGNKTTYDYDLTLRKTTIHYLGNPAITTDDLGDAVLIYDQAGYLTNYTDPLGNQTTYFYDSNHNLIKVRDPLTHEVQYTYNSDGHPTSIIDPLNKTLGSVLYNQYGGPKVMTTAQGGSATVQYDQVTFMPLSASDTLGSLGSYTWTAQGNPNTFTNQYGETTGYTYTPQGYVDTVTDPLGHKTHFVYDEFGRVTDTTSAYQTTDASTTHIVYDELGRQTQAIVAFGTTRAATTKYEYDANGNRTAVVDPLNRRTEYQYDNANRLTLVKYAAQSPAETTSTKYVYDIYGRLTDTTIAFGTADASTTHVQYDAIGRKSDVITAYLSANASTTHYVYYADGRVQDVTIANGTTDAATTHYVYDAAGRMTDVTIAVGTTDTSTTHYTYYDSGLTKSVTTAFGNASLAATTNYFYDSRGRSTITQYPDGTTTSQSYDLTPATAGWVNATTDQGGVTTKYAYDAAGRLDQLITSAFDSQTQQTLQQIRNYDYDAANRMTDSFDALNNRTSFTYYPTGQMATSKAWKDATTGFATTYDYNLAGEQISVLDANSHQTQYQYNERGMLKQTTYPGSVTTSQTYDFAGRLATSTDENGIVTKSAYNAAGELFSVTLAFGTADATTINYAYNFAGQLASMTDAKSHATSFLYNDAGQQTKKTLPDLTYEQYFYNAAGDMTSQRLADGNTNTFTYDILNRLTQIAYFDNQFANFTYLPSGQRDTASTRTTLLATPQVTDYDYDPFGRLKQVMVPDGRAVSYTYNNNDQRLSMTTPLGTGTITFNYGYNGLGQLATVTQGSATTTFTYDPVGFLTQKSLPNGVTTTYTPNVRDQLTNITNKNSANTVLQSFDYQLDNAGTRKKVTELGGSYITWDYDNLYRLKAEKRFNSSNAITWQASFLYDAAGNRTSQTVNSTTTTYQYNALDQLTSAGSITYQYNGRGDLTKITNGSNITNYTYDAADQLTNVTATGVNATYVYNADGKRVKQTLGSAVTNYLWDEASAYGDVVYEYNNSGGALASYVLGGAGLISQTRGTTTNYFLQDGQGSTRGLTNSTGTVTDTYSYTAFGESFATTGTTVNPYRYTGQQLDTSTGLYSLRARYYNPALGRFLSQDTYPVNFSNPIELNRYVYTANGPINAADPSGYLLAENFGLSGFDFRWAPTLTKVVIVAGAVILLVSALLDVADAPRVLPKIESLEQINMREGLKEWLKLRPNPGHSTDPKSEPTKPPPPPIFPRPQQNNDCPEGSHEINWPFPIWKKLGIRDSGATSRLYDGPNSGIPRILVKVASPEDRDQSIIGQYVRGNWNVLQKYYPRNQRPLGEIHHKWPLFLDGPDTMDNLVFLPSAQHQAWHALLYAEGVTGYMPNDPNGTVYCVVK